MENVMQMPPPPEPAIFLPTYTSDFRCPECTQVLPRSVTSAVGSKLEPCSCGYDSNRLHSPLPIPIS